MIVMVPTRELCIQVSKEIQKITELLGIKTGALYGGREVSGDKRTTSKRTTFIVHRSNLLCPIVHNIITFTTVSQNLVV